MPQITTVAPTKVRDTALSLLDSSSAPWVSIYEPVERTWEGNTTNRLRLEHRLDEARDQAAGIDLDGLDVGALLAPGSELIDDSSFWTGNLDGVALFLAPDEAIVARLPFSPSSFVGVGTQVHVRPLWRHMEPDGEFFVLGLSTGGSALYRATRYHVEEVPLDEGPTTLDEVLQYDDHIQSLQFHTETSPGSGEGGNRSAMFFGHEDAGDKRYVKEGILRFLRALDNQVRDILGKTPTETPLLLAGIEGLRGLYRQVNSSPHLLDDAIETSVIEPESRTWDADEVHRKAWPLVRPHFEADRREAIEQFHAAPERTAGNPGSVFLRAMEGRVDTLFVAETPKVWGSFDDANHTVRIHERHRTGDLELLNAAAVQTLQADGTVYVTEQADVPEELTIGALLRY